jgi:hypothetical protein
MRENLKSGSVRGVKALQKYERRNLDVYSTKEI